MVTISIYVEPICYISRINFPTAVKFVRVLAEKIKYYEYFIMSGTRMISGNILVPDERNFRPLNFSFPGNEILFGKPNNCVSQIYVCLWQNKFRLLKMKRNLTKSKIETHKFVAIQLLFISKKYSSASCTKIYRTRVCPLLGGFPVFYKMTNRAFVLYFACIKQHQIPDRPVFH